MFHYMVILRINQFVCCIFSIRRIISYDVDTLGYLFFDGKFTQSVIVLVR